MALIKLNATKGMTGNLPALDGSALTGISGGKVLQIHIFMQISTSYVNTGISDNNTVTKVLKF